MQTTIACLILAFAAGYAQQAASSNKLLCKLIQGYMDVTEDAIMPSLVNMCAPYITSFDVDCTNGNIDDKVKKLASYLCEKACADIAKSIHTIKKFMTPPNGGGYVLCETSLSTFFGQNMDEICKVDGTSPSKVCHNGFDYMFKTLECAVLTKAVQCDINDAPSCDK